MRKKRGGGAIKCFTSLIKVTEFISANGLFSLIVKRLYFRELNYTKTQNMDFNWEHFFSLLKY